MMVLNATDSPSTQHLDDASRFDELSVRIRQKPALRMLYEEIYASYARTVERTPPGGLIVELGSGGGFAKDVVPGLIATDVIPYNGIDRVVDATQMPFEDHSVRALLLMNVLHHIPDVSAFFREASRCLKPGGRMLIVDQYPGLPGGLVLRYAHHEPFDAKATAWSFNTTGPLSGANGALAWIVFYRDRARFEAEHPALHVERREPHTALRYWLAGGLKSWSLLPGPLFGVATAMDRAFAKVHSHLASFLDVEIVRR